VSLILTPQKLGGFASAIHQKTFTTGSIAFSSTEDMNIAGVPNSSIIVSAAVRRIAGKSTTVSAVLFETDAFSADFSGPFGGAWATHPLLGGEFGGVDLVDIASPGESKWTVGPSESAGFAFNPVFAYDRDGTGEWHLRVYNQDFGNSGTFEFRFSYYDTMLDLA